VLGPHRTHPPPHLPLWELHPSLPICFSPLPDTWQGNRFPRFALCREEQKAQPIPPSHPRPTPLAGAENGEGKSLGSHLASLMRGSLHRGKKGDNASVSPGTEGEGKGGICFPLSQLPAGRSWGCAESRLLAVARLGQENGGNSNPGCPGTLS